MSFCSLLLVFECPLWYVGWHLSALWLRVTAANLIVPVLWLWVALYVQEVAVRWTEIDGSKLSILASTFQMLRDLVLIRVCYLLRFWVIEGPLEGISGAASVWKTQRPRSSVKARMD